jgi:hypothetical protein
MIEVNRAPVLTLWAAVVAQRLGHDWETALSLGKAVAGLNAQAKGRRLGIYSKPEVVEGEGLERKAGRGEELWVQICGRPVPAKRTRDGLRAVAGDKAIDPDGVKAYLQGKLGDSYPTVKAALEALAGSYEPQDLEQAAYGLYERFRPEIPEGKRGWGQKGRLDLGLIGELARHSESVGSRGKARKRES